MTRGCVRRHIMGRNVDVTEICINVAFRFTYINRSAGGMLWADIGAISDGATLSELIVRLNYFFYGKYLKDTIYTCLFKYFRKICEIFFHKNQCCQLNNNIQIHIFIILNINKDHMKFPSN